MSSYQQHNSQPAPNHRSSFSSGKSSSGSSLTGHQRRTSQSSLSSITSTVTLPSNQPLDPTQSSIRDENEKLNKRLTLLRDEYVKFQAKYSDLQTRFDRLSSTVLPVTNVDPDIADFTGPKKPNIVNSNDASFISKIIEYIASLFNCQEYSDLSVEFADGKVISLHKFVLKLRSKQWGPYQNFDGIEKIELKELNSDIGIPLFNWVYSSVISLNSKGEDFILGLKDYFFKILFTLLIFARLQKLFAMLHFST